MDSLNITDSLIPEKKIIPEITAGVIVHSCNSDGFCVASIISGVFENFEDEGMVACNISFPAPNTVTVCSPTPIKYHKPENKDDRPVHTWHLLSECVGGCKRVKTAGRLQLIR